MLMSTDEKKRLEAKKAATATKADLVETQVEATAPVAEVPKGRALMPTMEYGTDALVELAAPVVLEQLQRIRERRESGVLTLTPAVIAQLGQLRLAGQQLLGIAGWR